MFFLYVEKGHWSSFNGVLLFITDGRYILKNWYAGIYLTQTQNITKDLKEIKQANPKKLLHKVCHEK